MIDRLMPSPSAESKPFLHIPSRDHYQTAGGWLTAVILRHLAGRPDDLVLTEHILRSGIVLELECHPDDRDQLVGEHRRVASAVNTLLHQLGSVEGEEYQLRSVPTLVVEAQDCDADMEKNQ